MSKKQAALVIVLSIIFSWMFSIFPGRLIMAKISTWPVLNHWKLLSPQAPIVINNRETVRVSDSGDVLAAVEQIKSKISTLVGVDSNNSLNVLGSAVNLTTDGTFVASSASFAGKPYDNYFVVLNDGRQAQISQKIADLGTSLTFFKAAFDNLPVAAMADSKDLLVGDKLVFIQGTLKNYTAKIAIGYVSGLQSDLQGQIFLSDSPTRSFTTFVNSPLVPGQALVNTAGEIAGLWNGSKIVSSDVLKQASDLYFSNPQKISRPAFGFGYSIVTKDEAALSGQVQGAKVVEILPQSAAQVAGLSVGDVITAINTQTISEDFPLEEVLQKLKPGDKISLSVLRKTQALTLSLTVGELK